jgi:2-oxoglutarate ferredoxin oxidoreductase subunit gamma
MRTERKEILLGGLGGQGVILAGVLLGQAASADGLFAAGSNSYGAQARGSSCKAEVVLASEPLDYPHAEAPDLLVCMSQGAYDAYGDTASPEGVILYDAGLVKPRSLRRELGFPVTALSVDTLGNKQAANVLWVGIVAGFTGWFSPESLARAVEEHVPERFLALNQKALDLGLELGLEPREA